MIAVVYYCYTINDWEVRLNRQLDRIKSSGLYDSADELHIIITDTENNKKDLVEKILEKHPKFLLNYTTRNWYEGYAIKKVDELARSRNDYKILYIHAKGVFNKFRDVKSMQPDDLKISGINCWVEMMEYFLIDNWKECVQKLETFDTVGVTNVNRWWWGNFWWTKSSHVQKNAKFDDWFGGSRWQCESWLHESNSDIANINYHEMYHFQYDPVYSVIPKYFYNSSLESEIKIFTDSAEYGYFFEQRDEGNTLLHDKNLTVDVTESVSEKIKNKTIYVGKNKNCCMDLLVNFHSPHDPAYGTPKRLRINFRTNIDPENKYTITYFV